MEQTVANPVPLFGSETVLPDFFARARFSNPYDASEQTFDYGFDFRTSPEGSTRIGVISDGRVFVTGKGLGQEQSLLETYSLNGDLRTEAGASNHLAVVVVGDEAWLAVNGIVNGPFDLPDVGLDPGSAAVSTAVGAGFFVESFRDGAVTQFSDFELWEIDSAAHAPAPDGSETSSPPTATATPSATAPAEPTAIPATTTPPTVSTATPPAVSADQATLVMPDVTITVGGVIASEEDKAFWVGTTAEGCAIGMVVALETVAAVTLGPPCYDGGLYGAAFAPVSDGAFASSFSFPGGATQYSLAGTLGNDGTASGTLEFDDTTTTWEASRQE